MILIKNILTAIGDPKLNCELKSLNKFNVIENDIQYQDGIFEILEINNNIDFIILNNLLPGDDNIEYLIEKILSINHNIKIIIILNEHEFNLKEKLIKKGVYGIVSNNNINNILNLINKNNNMEKYNEEIKKEIDELKKCMKLNKKNDYEINNKIIYFNDLKNNYNKKYIKKENKYYKQKNNIIKIIKNKIIIIFNNKKIIFNTIIKIINYINNKIKKLNKLLFKKQKYIYNKNLDFAEHIETFKYKDEKTIAVLGNNGAGKSVTCVRMAKDFAQKNNKVLVIDFDVLNNSLHTILGVKKYPEKIKNNLIQNKNEKLIIEDLIIKINKNIDLISGINLIFNSKNKITQDKLNNLIKNFSEKYNKIIIDTSSECFFDYTKEIMKISDECIFVTEPNLLEISKSKRFLEIYENQWEIDSKKIKILFNKITKRSIDYNILKKLYYGYEIIGNIKFNNKLIEKNKIIKVI